jgi:hypothetical protein
MIHTQTSFFYNKIQIENIIGSRLSMLESLCKNKKVLHIGCADSQYFTKNHNLHLFLSNICKELHGMDIDKETLDKLFDIYPGTYFTDLNEIKDEYNLVLVPEVLEHVLNVYDFLTEIFKIKADQYFITVPNCQHYCKEMIIDETSSLEIIHPDHKYWFSPYTLYNCLKPFIENKNIQMYYLESKSIVAALIG